MNNAKIANLMFSLYNKSVEVDIEKDLSYRTEYKICTHSLMESINMMMEELNSVNKIDKAWVMIKCLTVELKNNASSTILQENVVLDVANYVLARMEEIENNIDVKAFEEILFLTLLKNSICPEQILNGE